MRRTIRLGVLIAALLSSLATVASTASAVTWDNSGDTAYTATGGTQAFSSTGVLLQCSSSWFTGTVNATPGLGVNWAASSGTGAFTGCTMGGQTATVTCAYTITAASQTGLVLTGTADVQCTSRLAGTLICVTHGTTPGTYINPTLPSTFGTGSTVTGGAVKVTNGASNCPLGNGDFLHLSPTVLRITAATGGPTPHLGPNFTRTP